ncbi:hypothetical protein ABK040_000227 [Willaertia magna]
MRQFLRTKLIAHTSSTTTILVKKSIDNLLFHSLNNNKYYHTFSILSKNYKSSKKELTNTSNSATKGKKSNNKIKQQQLNNEENEVPFEQIFKEDSEENSFSLEEEPTTPTVYTDSTIHSTVINNNSVNNKFMKVEKQQQELNKEDDNVPIVIDTNLSIQKQNEILISSMDKLSKKYEKLERAVAAQQELLSMMSTTLHVIGEQQVQNRVLNLLKVFKIIPNIANNSSQQTFIRINTKDKLETMVTSFISTQHLPTAIQSIKKAIPHQLFVSGIDGGLQSYLDISNPNWIHYQSGGSIQRLVSGDVCMIGTLENITLALHRSLRYPILVRRFTSRVNHLLFQHPDQKLSIKQGMEKVILFVVVGTPKSLFEDTLPIQFFNKTLSEKDLDDLENYILSSFDGTIYLPEEEELEDLILKSDPMKDPLGVWKLLLSVEYNGKTILSRKQEVNATGNQVDDETKVKVLFLSLLKLVRIHGFDLFFGSVVNPLN